MTNIAIVCEAPADFLIASELADRVLVDAVEWLEEDGLAHQRTWIFDVNGTQLLWKHIKSLASELGIKVHGHFNSEAGVEDASTARKAILVLKKLLSPKAVMLIRDADKKIAARIVGLNQARDHFAGDPTIVIGVADPEREAWVLAGYDPDDDQEKEFLDNEREKLGFDPRVRSHELTATNDDQATKSPKRVLKVLTNDSKDREKPCWQVTALLTLQDRGQNNGLTPFLNEVRQKLVPFITGQQNPSA